MIMARKLKVRLRVIIPAVENSISGTSFRPRDIYTSRKGISVEIGNTDAEGRLVLADALTLADEDKPALVADFATLTGAARVALGPDVPAAFTDDDALADEIARFGASENDPLWRMPLWKPYETMLDSKVADTNNVSTGGQGGAITAALFLRKFVTAKSWLHLDIFAWTPAAKPGRPEGAELQTARALYRYAVRALLLTMVALDPRIHPFRPEVAAEYLKGQVEAARFVEGVRHEIVEPIAALRRTPSHEARLDTEALLGERVIVYETTDEGWAWGQLETDGYVGWLSANALGAPGPAPTHKVSVPRTFAFPGPDIKLTPAAALPMGARLAIARQDERFAVTANGWHLSAAHLSPIKARRPDFVAVAEEFRHTPYLWGGKTSLGVDCSGLVQVALQAAGIALPARQRHAGNGARQIVVARRTAPRRSGVLEGPCRHRPGQRNIAARQRASYGGGDRTRGRGHCPHQGGGQRCHQHQADLAREQFAQRGRD